LSNTQNASTEKITLFLWEAPASTEEFLWFQITFVWVFYTVVFERFTVYGHWSYV